MLSCNPLYHIAPISNCWIKLLTATVAVSIHAADLGFSEWITRRKRKMWLPQSFPSNTGNPVWSDTVCVMHRDCIRLPFQCQHEQRVTGNCSFFFRSFRTGLLWRQGQHECISAFLSWQSSCAEDAKHNLGLGCWIALFKALKHIPLQSGWAFVSRGAFPHPHVPSSHIQKLL